MKIEVQKLEKSKIKLTVTLPTEVVDKAFNKVVAEAAKNVEVKGFRKGKAPLKEVEKVLDPAKINGRVINILIPEAYTAAIKENKLEPITDPRIEIKKFARGNEFIFDAEIAEAPEVNLGNWHKAIENLTQKTSIETAATLTEAENKTKGEDKTARKLTTPEILKAVVSKIEVEIPEMLIEDEVNRMLGRLHDRLDALGLSPDEYLKSRGQTREDLRRGYAEQAQDLLKTEFTLTKLAEELQITVEEKDFDKAIAATKDEKARKSLNEPQNRAYIEAIIRKNKTIEKLVEIAGEKTVITS